MHGVQQFILIGTRLDVHSQVAYGNLLGQGGDLAHRSDHRLHCTQQLADLVTATGRDRHIQVANGEVVGHPHRGTERTDDAAGDKIGHASQQEDDQADDPGKLLGVVDEIGLNVIDIDAAADNPAPRSEALDVGDFGIHLF